MNQYLQIATLDIPRFANQIGDDGLAALAPKEDLFVDPLPVLPVDAGGQVGEEEGEGIAGAGAIEVG
jgi:hypothetical protein